VRAAILALLLVVSALSLGCDIDLFGAITPLRPWAYETVAASSVVGSKDWLEQRSHSRGAGTVRRKRGSIGLGSREHQNAIRRTDRFL